MRFYTYLLIGICALCAADADAVEYGHVVFDATQRYSRLVIDARLNDFYANTKQMGFQTYNADGLVAAAPAGQKNVKFDYVPGLVAKAVIEAVDYYQAEAWAQPWYYSVEWYATTYAGSVPSSGGSLDNLNAAKMYFSLYDLSRPGAAFANTTMASVSLAAMQTARRGLLDHNKRYSIASSTLPDAAGGWFHKSSYVNQMWLDGQYMGPALLAQLLNAGYGLTGDASADWSLLVRQFDITWQYLWDSEEQLLYHAMTATPGDQWSASWLGLSAEGGVFHSAEFWGRACGWYFLALVDVMEQMQLAGLETTADYVRMRTYLNQLAAGLARRQDATTGCWYQLLAHDGSFFADSYAGRSYERVYNYLESSATCIFTAAYLKGMRLGYYDADYSDVASRAYRGIIEQFLVQNTSDARDVHLIRCCRSAGLGGSNGRDGSAAYYLLGSDVTVTSISKPQTEGKVLGAFILAATEYERRYMPIASIGAVVSDPTEAVRHHYDAMGRRLNGLYHPGQILIY